MFTPKVIAKIKSNYPNKFGTPRQSGLVMDSAYIVFEPDFQNPDYVRGIDDFSHLWLIWHFDKSFDTKETPTVRPPKLGGNKRVGVFATRSPNRPNPIGLSLVKLDCVTTFNGSLALKVSGADLICDTPILDIKPYLPYVEAIQNADGGFTKQTSKVRLYVDFPPILQKKVDQIDVQTIINLLSLDPRPAYQNDPSRVYGMYYKNYNVKFTVDGDNLTVTDIEDI